MTVYLFSDIFIKHKGFFTVDSVSDIPFLYEIAFGFQPRIFLNNEDDKVIYDEEEEVQEMYFFQEGVVSIGFGLISNGFNDDSHHVALR